ncbi:MAG: DUF134 domain-containing protein [Anaerovoracaceae bacterium]
MPRPKKCRRVCCMPVSMGFEPVKKGNNKLQVIMTVDEYETIRLIDKQGLSQEECGEYMGVARTTAVIYNAPEKAAKPWLGASLKIEEKLCPMRNGRRGLRQKQKQVGAAETDVKY